MPRTSSKECCGGESVLGEVYSGCEENRECGWWADIHFVSLASLPQSIERVWEELG